MFATEPISNDEAAQLIKNKAAVSKEVFDQLPGELRARAITVAGIENLDTVAAIRDRIASLPEGANWNEVKKDIIADLSPWLNETASHKRAELLLRHHAFSAYAAAQAKEMDALIDVFPYRQYLSTGDQNVRRSHAALHGVILPATHDFWKKHTPPWEFNCRCNVVELTQEDMEEERELDGERAASERRVLSDLDLDRLEKENRLARGDAIVDTRTPRDRGENYELNVRDLTIPYEVVEKRWDAETLKEFNTWAGQTEITDAKGEKNSLLGWLKGIKSKIAPTTTLKERTPLTPLAEDLLKLQPVSYGTPSLIEKMDKQVQQSIAHDENKIRYKVKEHGMLYDQAGTMLWRGEGKSNQITIPASVDLKGAIFTHNHPGGSSFSIEDIEMLFDREMAEVRAVTKRGTFSISSRRTTNFNIVLKAMQNKGPIIIKTLQGLEKDYSEAELIRLESHFMHTLLANEGLINYHFIPMKPEEPLPETLSAHYLNLTPQQIQKVENIDIDEYLSRNGFIAEKAALTIFESIALWKRIKAEGKVPEWAK